MGEEGAEVVRGVVEGGLLLQRWEGAIRHPPLLVVVIQTRTATVTTKGQLCRKLWSSLWQRGSLI